MLDARLLEQKVAKLEVQADKADKALNLLVDMFKTQEGINTDNTQRHINQLLLMKTMIAKVAPKSMTMDEYAEVNKFLDDIIT